MQNEQAAEHNISFYHIFIILHKLTRGRDKKNTSQTTIYSERQTANYLRMRHYNSIHTHLAVKYRMKSAN